MSEQTDGQKERISGMTMFAWNPASAWGVGKILAAPSSSADEFGKEPAMISHLHVNHQPSRKSMIAINGTKRTASVADQIKPTPAFLTDITRMVFGRELSQLAASDHRTERRSLWTRRTLPRSFGNQQVPEERMLRPGMTKPEPRDNHIDQCRPMHGLRTGAWASASLTASVGDLFGRCILQTAFDSGAVPAHEGQIKLGIKRGQNNYRHEAAKDCRSCKGH